MLRKNPALFQLMFLFAVMVMIAGCGSGVTTNQPNPSGFTNSNLNGTYAFAISGFNGAFFTIVGSFVANGNGMITGGTEDINLPGSGALGTNVALSGTYVVRPDGRTVATITSTSLNPAFKFTLDFVLLNPQKGLVIEFDQTATASGTVDLQNSSAFNLASLAGAFAFNVSGIDGLGNSESTVGLIKTDNAGNITSGTLDDNDNFAVTSNQPLTATTLTAPAAASGRGTATIGTRNYAYYVVDTNHLKLIEIDNSGPFLGGDAFRQSSTAVSGSFVFTMAGQTNTGHGLFVAGGILNTDGVSAIQSTSLMDIDDGGALTPSGGATVQGTFSVTNGRGTMQLTGPLTLNLVFYPSTGGLQLLDVDAGVINAGGAALPQSGAPFSNSSINNGYGLNFTGVVGPASGAASEIDAIAQFNASGGSSISGALDSNNSGALDTSLALSGNFTVGANGRGTARLNTPQGPMNLIFYMGSNSQVLFVELDESFGQITVGSFAAQ